MSERTRAIANSVFCGIILANLAICSSPSFERFAPFAMTATWLFAGAFMCGSILGITLDDAKAIFYGLCSMALIAVLIFSGVLIFIARLNDIPSYDLVSLLAFQQSFVRFIFIFILGGVGASIATLLKLFFSGGL